MIVDFNSSFSATLCSYLSFFLFLFCLCLSDSSLWKLPLVCSSVLRAASVKFPHFTEAFLERFSLKGKWFEGVKNWIRRESGHFLLDLMLITCNKFMITFSKSNLDIFSKMWTRKQGIQIVLWNWTTWRSTFKIETKTWKMSKTHQSKKISQKKTEQYWRVTTERWQDWKCCKICQSNLCAHPWHCTPFHEQKDLLET